MSDYKLPELPSDDELGITDEDREAFEKEMGGDAPEMSEAEMRALLGDAPQSAAGAGADPKPTRAQKRAAKKAAKAARKAEKERKKEAEHTARATAAAAAPVAGEGTRTPETPGLPPAGAPPSGGEPGTEEGEGPPRRRWRGPLTLATLLAVAAVASTRTGLPRPVPANAPDTVFSSARAMSTLIEIARDAHPPGSPEHDSVRVNLLGRLQALGLEPEVQTTTALIEQPTRARAATVRNIVARIPGTDPTGAVLLTAHYDGRGISHAASDDGVGVVTVVETVRALRAGAPLRNDLIVLLTDAEELGLLGARAFVNEHPWMEDVSIVLSVEMRGSAGPSIMFETADQNGWVIRALDDFDSHPSANSLSFEIYSRMPNDTDFTPFREAGKQGLNFAAIDNAHVYHQVYDTPQVLDESTLQHHGIHLLGAAKHFGEVDLAQVNAPNLAYFTVPVLGLVVYPQAWSYALGGLLVLLLVGGFFAARRAGARPSRVGLALALSLLGAALASGATWGLMQWLPGFHPEMGSLQGSLFHREGWYVVTTAAIAFTLVILVHFIARRWLTPLELALGGLVVPLVAAAALGFAMPLAAMNLQWPALAALASAVLLALLGERSEGIVGWLAAVLLTVPVLLLLVPLTELLWLALTFGVAPALAALIAVTLHLCLPALEALRHPNRWWAPVTGLLVGGAALGLGLLTSRPNGARPAPSTLTYAYEHGTGAAIWVTDPTTDSLDADAITWARERAGGIFPRARDLSGFGYQPAPRPINDARVVSAEPPQVVLTRDTIDGDVRRVTMNVRSRIGAEGLAFTFDERGDTRVLSINGRALSSPDSLEWLEHWGVPDPAVELELTMPADEAIGLHVVEHLLRPEELLGTRAFDRPPHLAPDITQMSDRAIFRYSVGAFVDPRYRLPLPSAPTDAGAVPGGETPAAAGDTTAVDTIRGDTVAGDTLAADTTAVDTLPADTTAVDTLPPDTTVVDTLVTGTPGSATRSPRTVPWGSGSR